MNQVTGRRPIRAAALVPYPKNRVPSQRYRIEQWVPFLLESGIEVDLFPFVDDHLMKILHTPGHGVAKSYHVGRAFARRLSDLRLLHRYDVVVIHRAACIAGPAAIERLISLMGRPILFDFDDAIFLLHSSAENRRLGWLKFPGKTATICRLSSHVVAGNGYLAEYAARYCKSVSVVPTSVDTTRYLPRARVRDDSKVVIGWTGSSTSQTHLEMFAPVLRELAGRRDIEIRVHSDRRPSLPGVPHVWRTWTPHNEVEEISRFDIGIMPMPDDRWSLGKCSMKALLYMSVGAPAVCSAVGANREVITDGVDGFLASSETDWLSILERLVDDRGLRQVIGRAGRLTVEARYSSRVSADAFANAIRRAIERPRDIHERRVDPGIASRSAPLHSVTRRPHG